MSRQDAVLNVYCDGPSCDEFVSVDLTALAMSGSWDERNVEEDLEDAGWCVKWDKDYCSGCTIDLFACEQCGDFPDEHDDEDHEFVDPQGEK